MSGYLLLRDNKQTGPFSPEELIEKGFKPYDLIWSEGKSAGWRYPSEFPEFSKFAPIVEEQPFDRFYKKPAGNNVGLHASERIPAFNKPEVQQEAGSSFPVPPTKEEEVVERPAARVVAIHPKKIFVTLPPNAEVVKAETSQPQSNFAKAIAEEKQAINDIEAKAEALKEKIFAAQQKKTTPPIAKEISVNENFSSKEYSSYNLSAKENSSLVEDKIYSMHQEEKIAPSTKTVSPSKNPLKAFTLAAVAACLLLGGVVIGLVISGSKESPEQQQLNALVKQIQERENAKREETSIPKQTAGIIPDQPASSKENVDSKDPSAEIDIARNTVHTQQRVPVNEKNIANEPKVISTIQNNVESTSTKNEVPVTAEKKPADKIDEVAIASARKNIWQLVSVSGNKYKVGVLGGISNLELAVANNSLYPIDEVEITVNYHGPEKRIVRKEAVIIYDIAAGEQKSVAVPKSKRGVSVTYTITKINSRVLGLAHSGL